MDQGLTKQVPRPWVSQSHKPILSLFYTSKLDLNFCHLEVRGLTKKKVEYCIRLPEMVHGRTRGELLSQDPKPLLFQMPVSCWGMIHLFPHISAWGTLRDSFLPAADTLGSWGGKGSKGGSGILKITVLWKGSGCDDFLWFLFVQIGLINSLFHEGQSSW